MLDGTHRLGRLKGVFQVSGGVSNETHALDLSDGTPFYSFQPDRLFYHISGDTPPPIFTVDATGISWVYNNGATAFTHRITGWVYVGVY